MRLYRPSGGNPRQLTSEAPALIRSSRRGGPPFTGDTSLFQFFGYFGLFCATVLILRVIVAILRDGLN